jgi:hypothetical protein
MKANSKPFIKEIIMSEKLYKPEINNQQEAETEILMPTAYAEGDAEKPIPFAKIGQGKSPEPFFPRSVAGGEEMLLPPGVGLPASKSNQADEEILLPGPMFED